MSYNLSDNVNDSFDFSIKDKENKVHTFEMRYPLVEEIERMQDMQDKQTEAKTDAEKVKLAKDAQSFMYSFITPTGDHKDSVETVLKKSNIKVLDHFNRMIQTEFGIN